MAAKKKLPDRVQFAGLDSLFGIEQIPAGQIVEVPIVELTDFKNHPFKVLDDEKMEKLVESIRENGILNPLIVREMPDGGYELVSGHRRKHAAGLIGLETVPVMIREMTDDEATIAMIDANLQREEILPSEKAFAYKMRLEAFERVKGRPKKGSQRVPEYIGKRTTEIIAQDTGESYKQIQRYIRLTELLPEILDMVDAKKMKLNPAVEISYLKTDEQKLLLKVMEDIDRIPSLSQAQYIKRLSRGGNCSYESVFEALRVPVIKEKNVTIRHEVIMQYFNAETSEEEIERIICNLLKEHYGR